MKLVARTRRHQNTPSRVVKSVEQVVMAIEGAGVVELIMNKLTHSSRSESFVNASKLAICD